MTERQTRMTQQRRVILEELRKTDTHPTAEELHDMVRKILPRISLGTVYRNLDLLVREGEVLRLDHEDGRRRFDGNVHEPHYHAQCVFCGSVGDLPLSVVKHLQYDSSAPDGFEVHGCELTFTGVCASCQRSTQESE